MSFRGRNQGRANWRSGNGGVQQAPDLGQEQTHYSQSSGSRGGLGRGSGGGNRSRNNQGRSLRDGDLPGRPPRMPGPPPPNVPAPSHLSKTSSAEQNDPLYKEAFVPEPGTELRPMPGLTYFGPTNVGLPELVSQVYNALVSKDNNFGRRISESAFFYYVSVGTYSRMLSIAQYNNQQVTELEKDFVDQVKRTNPSYPSVIASYINAFGNFTGKDGTRYYQQALPRPDPIQFVPVPGIWPVDNGGHVLYQDIMSPAICALRILNDMQGVVQWNLPAAAIPAPWMGFNPGNPTENLLGWRPGVHLRPEAHQFLAGAGVGENDFRSTNPAMAMNTGLIIAINEYLERNSLFVPMKINYDAAGSGGSFPWVEPSPGNTYPVGSGQLQRSETLVQYSEVSIDARVGAGGAAFMLRQKRRVLPGTEAQREAFLGPFAAQPPAAPGPQVIAAISLPNNWCCYSWDDYMHVPFEWRDAANLSWEVMPSNVNTKVYYTTAFDQRSRLKGIIRAFETPNK